MRRRKSTCESAKEAAKAIFQHYDLDHNGYLESDEVLKFLTDITQPKHETSPTQASKILEKLLSVADENGDNKISL